MKDPAKPMPDGFPLAPLDQTGRRISAGDGVTILSVVSCARNLPEDDQIHLQSFVGQNRQIVEFDQYGFVWLSFTATDKKADFCLFPHEVSKS